jgi:hypothetical protein
MAVRRRLQKSMARRVEHERLYIEAPFRVVSITHHRLSLSISFPHLPRIPTLPSIIFDVALETKKNLAPHSLILTVIREHGSVKSYRPLRQFEPVDGAHLSAPQKLLLQIQTGSKLRIGTNPKTGNVGSLAGYRPFLRGCGSQAIIRGLLVFVDAPFVSISHHQLTFLLHGSVHHVRCPFHI